MARITNFLKLWLPEADEVYDVEKDQNENFEKIDTKLKEWDSGKEPAITKKSGFNLDKTNLTENDSNKLFTAKGALDLFNTLTTNFTNAVNSAKEYFRTELVKKIDKTSKSDAVNSTSSETVATSVAVKTAYDKGVEALNVANTKLSVSYCPYQVGDMYLTTSATNPATKWTGTTWQKIEGRFLRATTSSESAGVNGGSDTKTLTVANLPAHSHSGSTNSAGAHSHTQSAHSHTQPAHKHNLHTDYTGNSSLTGRSGFAVEGGASKMGLSSAYIKEAGGEQTGAATPAIQNAGAHTHTVSIGNTGNGTAFDVVPAYMTVHIWKRVS